MKFVFTKLLLLVLLCIVVISANAGWERNFGGSGWDEGSVAIPTDDGGVVICGHGESFGHHAPGDIYLMKINYFGSVEWRYYYGSTGLEVCRSITRTSDGGYAMCGYTTLSATGPRPFMYIVKTDSLGREAWTHTYSGCIYAESITELDDGRLLIAGMPYMIDSPSYNIMMTDATGDSLWVMFTGDCYLRDVISNEDSTFIAVGTYRDDIYIVNFNCDGEVIWERTYGGVSNEKGYCLEHSGDGNYYVVGTTMSYGLGINGYMLKVDCDGDTLWSKIIGGSNFDFIVDIEPLDDGGFALVGSSNSFSDNYDMWLLRTDSELDTIWTKFFGGAQGNDRGVDVVSTDDGGFFLTGWTESYSEGNRDFYMVNCNSEGYTVNPYLDLKAGWNLVSWPYTFTTHPATFYFLMPPLYEYDSEEGNYIVCESIERGEGVWMLSPVDTVYKMHGTFAVPEFNLRLYPGWNLIGTTAIPIDIEMLTEDHPEIMTPIYYYNASTHEYNALDTGETMMPSVGYWVLCSEIIDITLPE